MSGDFIPSHGISSEGFLLQRLCDQVCSLAPIPTSQHGAVPGYIPKDVQQARFVFIRRDADRTPLQRPYEGIYEVLQPGINTFKLNRGGKPDTISIDRLKPAHMDLEHSSNLHPMSRAPKRPQAIPADTTSLHNQSSPNTSRQVCTHSGHLSWPQQRYILILGGAVWRKESMNHL